MAFRSFKTLNFQALRPEAPKPGRSLLGSGLQPETTHMQVSLFFSGIGFGQERKQPTGRRLLTFVDLGQLMGGWGGQTGRHGPFPENAPRMLRRFEPGLPKNGLRGTFRTTSDKDWQEPLFKHTEAFNKVCSFNGCTRHC